MRTGTLDTRRPEFLARAGLRGEAAPAAFAHAPGSAVHVRALAGGGRREELPPSEATERPPAPGCNHEREIAERAARVEEAVARLRLVSERLAAEARADALEVALIVARRIVDAELAVNVEPLVASIRSAIRRLGESRRIVVRLAPADAEAVTAAAGGASGIATADIQVLPDTSLERGDCVVEGDHATVDGRLATRFDEIRRALISAALEEAP